MHTFTHKHILMFADTFMRKCTHIGTNIHANYTQIHILHDTNITDTCDFIDMHAHES